MPWDAKFANTIKTICVSATITNMVIDSCQSLLLFIEVLFVIMLYLVFNYDANERLLYEIEFIPKYEMMGFCKKKHLIL